MQPSANLTLSPSSFMWFTKTKRSISAAKVKSLCSDRVLILLLVYCSLEECITWTLHSLFWCIEAMQNKQKRLSPDPPESTSPCLNWTWDAYLMSTFSAARDDWDNLLFRETKSDSFSSFVWIFHRACLTAVHKPKQLTAYSQDCHPLNNVIISVGWANWPLSVYSGQREQEQDEGVFRRGENQIR